MPDEAAPVPAAADEGSAAAAPARASAARIDAARVYVGRGGGAWIPTGWVSTTPDFRYDSATTTSGFTTFNLGGSARINGSYTMTISNATPPDPALVRRYLNRDVLGTRAVSHDGWINVAGPSAAPPRDRPRFAGPFCTNVGCPCGTPGPVCDEFKPCDDDDVDPFGCAECGWNECAHEPANADRVIVERGAETTRRTRERERVQVRERQRTAINAANARARETLRRLLTAEQRAMYDERGHFELTGSHGGRYRIRAGSNGNVDFLRPDQDDGTGALVVAARLCAHPALTRPEWRAEDSNELPLPDVALAQMLHLTSDELGWLGIANVHAASGRAFQEHVLAITAASRNAELDRAEDAVRAAADGLREQIAEQPVRFEPLDNLCGDAFCATHMNGDQPCQVGAA